MSPAAARQILHVDMDAFFAAVEVLDDPSLRGKPVLVGGAGRRGVVAAASYEARPFGARSAMPMVEALRRCPHAVVVPARHHRYAEVSRRLFAIFRTYTPLVEALSIDEAFLDVTASRALWGDGEAVARVVKAAVRDELGLTASAGVAASKFVAKVASDLRKPDGLVVVGADAAAFLAPLPIERMWGVGPKAAHVLRRAGFRTLGDLAQADAARLTKLLGGAGARVGERARGVDERPVTPGRQAKSVAAENTFEHDLTEPEAIERHLLEQSARVARRLMRAGVRGRSVTLKIKYADFRLCTRRATLPEPVCDTESIYRTAKALLVRVPIAGERVRLTGVAVGDLAEGPPAPTLFPDPGRVRRERLEELSLRVDERFGAGALTRARLLEGGRLTSKLRE